jgi:tripartite-type tricarboxylate transporter receptor subunit TctC
MWAALVLGALCAIDAGAQSYPSRPIRLIVANAPGGPTDFVARVLADPLSKALGVPIVVENRIGAGGVVGTDYVAKADPDGYTLMLSAPGPIVITPHLNSALPYKPERDFVPIAAGPTSYFLLIVPPTSPVHSLADLIGAAKRAPGKLNYASAGIGTPPHIAAELLKRMTGIDIVHVPYRGVPQAEASIISGETSFMFDTFAAMNLARAGKVLAIAVSGPTRSARFPEIPTIAESGVPGFEAGSWYGLFAPAGTPDAIVLMLNEAMGNVLRQAAVAERFGNAGYQVPPPSSPAEFAARVRHENERWGNLIRDAKIRME